MSKYRGKGSGRRLLKIFWEGKNRLQPKLCHCPCFPCISDVKETHLH